MPVPFIDLKAQYASIKAEMDAAIAGILARTEFVTGPTVKAFEAEFAKAHGVEHCVSCNSGTSAIHLLLWGLGIGEGDEVILPANTFIATAGGVKLSGARPVLVDVCEDFLMDVSQIEAAITAKTKAIFPVHLYGQPADMDALSALCKKHNLLLIEDCAQAHLATYKGQKVGSFGAGGAFSFYPGKNLGAFGEGGAVITKDADLAAKMRSIRDHGSSSKYVHEIWGHNYRMEGLQGAVLGVKLKHLEAWTAKRRQVADWYREELASLQGLTCPIELPDRRHVYHLFEVRIGETFGTTRAALMEAMQTAGVACGLHYPTPIHLQPAAKELGYKKGDFPVAEMLADEILSLPIFAEMTREMVAEASGSIRKASSQMTSSKHSTERI
jgi:dTDP-4-amino-4,6-dideoxygalactose transaminase